MPSTVLSVDGMTHECGPAARPSASADPPDATLIARSCAGDAAALDALVRRHYRTAYSVALANTGRRADAEDVCHDALIRVAEQLETCRDPARFAQWMCAIVRNRARNAHERERVRRAEPLDEHIVRSAHDSHRDAQRAELRARLLAALGVLTPVQREVVLLHDLAGWTHEAIADLVGTSEGMSRQHLFQARRRLRGVLGPDILEYLDD